MKPIRPLFKWFGSKWSAAKHYPKPLEDLPVFEPFAGSAGYALNHHEHDVTIWDIDPNITILWKWIIQDSTSDLVKEIPVDLEVGTDIRELGLTTGQQYLLKHWQRTNNKGNCWTISPWGNKPGQWTENTRARVAEEIHAVKHWKYEPVSWNQPGTYFVDPPYIFNYKYGYPDFDYKKLVENIAGLPKNTRVIACEARDPKTGEIPTYLPFYESHSQVTSRRKETQSHHSKELVYVMTKEA